MEFKQFSPNKKTSILQQWINPLLLFLVLGISLYFRTTGLFWGDYQYLHPDERFLIWVTSDISSVDRVQDYFDTAISSLNPHNRGHGFYVYGDFPVIFTRYISEIFLENVNWEKITQIGRGLSVLFDFGSVILVFFIGKKLFNNKIALLATAFSGSAVLQIQQSHYYTVDTFATFFSMLAVYFAILIYKYEWKNKVERVVNRKKISIPKFDLLMLSVGFGVLVGLAAASKINTVFVAVLLPISYSLLWNRYPQEDPVHKIEIMTRDLVLGGLFAFLTFRIFQPYAFEGPGFLNIGLNPKWLANIKEISYLASGDVDYPPALQWARRNFFFSAKNITLWGLGIPMSIALWSGMELMGLKILQKEWKYSIILFWTAGYFIWQSSVENPMMRYQLPIYPLFCLISAWFIYYLIDHFQQNHLRSKVVKTFGYILGTVALLGTLTWAFMFTKVYTNPNTRVAASEWIYENVPGPINILVNYASGIKQEVFSVPYDYKISESRSYSQIFSLIEKGNLESILFGKILSTGLSNSAESELTISLYDIEQAGELLATGVIRDTFSEKGNGKGISYSLKFDQEILLEPEHNYQIVLDLKGPGSIILSGSAVAVETDWDDGLPLRMNGKDAYGGIYQGDLNFQMYWNDDQSKLDRFYSTLNQSDYIFISSNRQWGTTTRVPEKYPLTTQFYKSLLGCPNEQDIYWCYSVAKPGLFKGELGFELIKVFESYPSLGEFKINDQFSEEAFTVYDHPKVLIFKKSKNYEPTQVLNILSAIDLSKVLSLTPAKVPDYPANLELPPQKLTINSQGGTWADLFKRDSIVNSSPLLSIALWYFSITIFGWLIYPIVRLMMSGLSDKGYAFSKLIGMLLLAIIVWWAGSYNFQVTRQFILFVVILITIVGLLFGFIQRKEIAKDLKNYKYHFLTIEILALLLFVVFLFIRIGNPDLWHPAKGGEKPMDFSYLNAVIKSATFPPYDPWYSDGFINYYYYGFIIVGLWVKLLGIIPSVAYNLILPFLFSVMGIGAYGIGWNLLAANSKNDLRFGQFFTSFKSVLKSSAFLTGISSIVFVTIIGNLGTVRMIWHGFQKLGSPTGSIELGNIFDRVSWTVQGIIEFFGGANLPFYPGDWYWVPSRALPQSPITEFPFFTFLYADLHAHLLALPITILAIGWILSIISSHWQFESEFPKTFIKISTIFLGGLVIGALRPTNTWDFPTYLILAVVVIIYTILKAPTGGRTNHESFSSLGKYKELFIVLFGFIFITFFFYKPFTDWYAQAYSSIELWKGAKSPFWSYFTHWGFFLVIILSWFFAETIQWMAQTPLSSLRKLAKYQTYLWIGFFMITLAIILLTIYKVQIAWLVVILMIWALLLILRSTQGDSERFVLFLVGTGLLLTLFVELFVLRGDIGRMNTVFKFYLQAWVMLALSSAYGLVWLIKQLRTRSDTQLIRIWTLITVFLFSCAAIYPIFASIEKIDDRIANNIPLTIDGMEYMKYSTYFDENTNMDLSEDYYAIQWIQDHVKGSPVIVEANTVEYRWGSRFSIYTGLPSVVGWNWHQRQQRAALPSEWVTDRVNKITNFYNTMDIDKALNFIEKYDVKYIIVGQLENALYPNGIDKFNEYNNIHWKEVFHIGETRVFEVK